jgi:hypothetical protein
MFRQSFAPHRNAALAWATVFFLGYVGYYARTIYPIIPRSLGGGGSTPAIVIFNDHAPAALRNLQGTRREVRLLVLTASESSIVFLIGGRAVEVSRELVGAVTYDDVSLLRKPLPAFVERELLH